METSQFDRMIDRAGTASLKWGRYPGEVLPMWIADMDFQSPPGVREALARRVEHGVFGYTYPDISFRDSIVSWYADRHHWQIDPEWIVFMTGVVSGLNNFCQAFKSDYPTVVVQTPVYPPILHAPGVAGMNRIEVPFIRQADGRYAVDLDTLEQAFSRGRSLFILCNPQNPTGRVFEQTELEAIADLCDRYDVLVCADEIHSDLVFAPHKHIPFASLRQSSPERTITFAAPSKTFNIAGLGCAYAVIPSPELRERFKRQAEAFSGHINALGLTAGLAAYKTGGEWLESLLTYLTENRQLMQDFFKAELPDVGFYPPEGTYLAWLDFSRLDISDLAAFLLEKGAVAVNPGLDFGNPGARFVRLNFGCPRLLLEDGLSRISRALLANR